MPQAKRAGIFSGAIISLILRNILTVGMSSVANGIGKTVVKPRPKPGDEPIEKTQGRSWSLWVFDALQAIGIWTWLLPEAAKVLQDLQLFGPYTPLVILALGFVGKLLRWKTDSAVK